MGCIFKVSLDNSKKFSIFYEEVIMTKDLSGLFDDIGGSTKALSKLETSPETKVGLEMWSNYEVFTWLRLRMMLGVIKGMWNGYHPLYMFPIYFVKDWITYPLQILWNYRTMPFHLFKIARQHDEQHRIGWSLWIVAKMMVLHPFRLLNNNWV